MSEQAYILLYFNTNKDHGLEAFGQLVLLGFDISAFTPAAYLRHRL